MPLWPSPFAKYYCNMGQLKFAIFSASTILRTTIKLGRPFDTFWIGRLGKVDRTEPQEPGERCGLLCLFEVGVLLEHHRDIA